MLKVDRHQLLNPMDATSAKKSIHEHDGTERKANRGSGISLVDKPSRKVIYD
jgi:hypothetical protein